MKHPRFEQSNIDRKRIRFALSLVTGTAGNRSVCTVKCKSSLRVLFQGEGWAAKRTLIVTGLAIAAAERTEFELAIVWVLVAVLA